MKSANLILSSLLVLATSSAFASAACNLPSETSELETTEGYENLFEVNVIENPAAITTSEEEMIAEVIAANVTEPLPAGGAVDVFIDAPHNYNGGEIKYISLNGTTLALVTFYPGENEVGAIFEMSTTSSKKKAVRNASFTKVADVSDGGISCVE